MNEKKSRKEWVKSFAIVFLSVLLVLTFFSNTIRNYSLPEVAAQYTNQGTITNKVRGQGMVDAQDPYSVVFKQSRKVGSVNVRVGDAVEKGDVLFFLEEGESAELEEARKLLETLQSEYDKNLILGEISKDLVTKVENNTLGNTSELQAKVAAAKKKVENARTYLTNLQNATPSTDSHIKELNEWLDNMRNNIIPGVESAISSNESAISAAKAKYVEVATQNVDVNNKDKVNVYDYLKDAITYFLTTSDADVTITDDQRKKLDKAKYDLGASSTDASFTTIQETIALVRTLCETYNRKDKEFGGGGDGSDDRSKIYKFDDCITYNTLLQREIDNINKNTNALAENQKQLAACNKQVQLWEEEKAAGSSDASKIAAAEAALAKAEKEYETLISDISTSYSLKDQLAKIEEQKKIVEKLEGEQIGGEIVAPVTGTVMSLNYVAGETIDTGSTVATIQVAGKGFTLTMNVTNEQASLLKPGDEAEVINSWWYTDVHARIISIRPNAQNPQAGKIVTFELEGDVTNGQTLSLSVGQRSATYDCIVPNSAIREDNKGKFVYRVVSKSSPLGTRYSVERVDVKVLAEEDTQSAISGALDNWEYIVTTSSKPLTDGQLIRLKNY